MQAQNVPVHTMPAAVVAVLPVIKKLKIVKDAEEQRRRSDEERRHGHGYAWEWLERRAGCRSREASYSSMIRKLCQVQNAKQNTEKDQSQRGRGNKKKKKKKQRQRRETTKQRRGACGLKGSPQFTISYVGSSKHAGTAVTVGVRRAS